MNSILQSLWNNHHYHTVFLLQSALNIQPIYAELELPYERIRSALYLNYQHYTQNNLIYATIRMRNLIADLTFSHFNICTIRAISDDTMTVVFDPLPIIPTMLFATFKQFPHPYLTINTQFMRHTDQIRSWLAIASRQTNPEVNSNNELDILVPYPVMTITIPPHIIKKESQYYKLIEKNNCSTFQIYYIHNSCLHSEQYNALPISRRFYMRCQADVLSEQILNEISTDKQLLDSCKEFYAIMDYFNLRRSG